VQWTTNYYGVSGGDLREIRRSLRQNRPWKARHEAEAFTEWKVEWRFQTAQTENGCRVTGFGTKTIVLVTLPRWSAPTNSAVSEVTSNAWHRYIRALGQHESGHVSIALAAAPEMARRVAGMSVSSDCGGLANTINGVGEQVLREQLERERAYDERTRHGLTQGATLGGPQERERERGAER
jgi:predicted secreted Zn-dependent protease